MRTARPRGSTLLYVVIAIAILAAGSAAVLRPVSDEYLNTFRTAGWQEALLAAESGVDLATIQLRQNLSHPGAGWPSPWTTAANGSLSQTASFTHAGLGSTQMQVSVVVDAPSALIDSTGQQYYRIRSTGTNSLSGGRRAGGERRDLDLRKFSLVRNRFTGAALSQPTVSRTIEVIARPSSAFPLALLSKNSTTITNQNVTVDSYDSDDPTKSTKGQWDVSKRQSHGDVATDGTLIAAGNAHIYGNVSTNGGSVSGVNNITGTIRDDFWQDIPSVSAPAWGVGTYTAQVVSGNTSLTAGTTNGASLYKIPNITLSGNDVLTIKAASGGGSTRTYVDIYVTGSVSISGNASIQMDRNVIATFYITGNTDIGGNGVSNGNGSTDDRPANLVIKGIQPAAGVTQTLKLNGNADVESSIFAPDADVTIVGGGSDGSFSGSVVGKTVFMNGVTAVHYDEALGRHGIPVGYRIASWCEDTR